VSILKPNRTTPEFRAAAIAFFLEQVVEQSTWVGTILYAYQQSGTRTAGIYMSAMLIVASVLGPFQARALERFRPFRAASLQLGVAAALTFVAAALVVFRAPGPLVWVGLGLIACTATTGPATLFGLIPSTAHNAEALAIQNAQMGWMESAALIAGPGFAAAILSATEINDGLALLTITSGILLLVGRMLLRRHLGMEVDQHNIDPSGSIAGAGEQVKRSEHSELPESSRHSELTLLRMPSLRTLGVLTFGAYLAVGALDVLYVPVSAAAGLSESNAGLLASAYGVGSLVSFAASRRIVGRPRLTIALVASGVLGSIAIASLSLTEGRAFLAFGLVAMAGAARSVFTALHRVLLQRSAPAGSLLRVAGVFQVVITVGFAAGVLVPWLAGSTARACVATGLLLPIAMLIGIRGLGKVDDAANVPVTEIALLRQVTIFRSLTPEALESVARESAIKTFADGPIVRQGDVGMEMFVIIDGTVEVRQYDMQSEAPDRFIRTMTRGEAFGEIALIRRQRRTATVSAIGTVSVLAIPGANFVSLVGVHDGVASAVDGLITMRL
jgi:Cyclic nucleotide-binding domain